MQEVVGKTYQGAGGRTRKITKLEYDDWRNTNWVFYITDTGREGVCFSAAFERWVAHGHGL